MTVSKDSKISTVNFVRKTGGEWCIFSKDGKKLECKSIKAEAEKRLAQIEHFSRQGNSMLRVNVRTKVNNAEIRNEKRNGRDVIVVPSATLPFGVVMNGGMYPEDEIKKSYMTLNRKPAPMGHPMVNKMYVSAMEPEAINEYYVGAWNENVRIEGNRVKLDKIIDVQRANESEKGRKLLEAINKGEPIHTSTGLMLEPEPVQNADYKWIARNMEFDHDAILLNEPGAATPEQGVGMMVNSSGEQIEVQNAEVEMSEPMEEAKEAVDWAAMHLARTVERYDSVSRFDAIKDRLIEAVRSVMGGKPEEDASLSVNSNEDSDMPITEEQFNELKGQVEQLASNQLKKEDLEAMVKPVTDQVEEMKANAKAREDAEKEGLVAKVVAANILEEEEAKEMSVNVLKKLAAKAEPQGAYGIFGGVSQANSEDKLSSDLPE